MDDNKKNVVTDTEVTDQEKYLDALNNLSQVMEVDAAQEEDRLEETKKQFETITGNDQK